MKLKNLICSKGHPIGNITFKLDDKENNDRRYVRRMIDNVFYCQTCKKFYKMLLQEVEFTPLIEKSGK